MITNLRFSLYLFLLVFLSNTVVAQNALTATINNPTYNKECKNGEIDLMINEGFPPYDVVWKRISFNGTQLIQTTSNIQGNNDGEDLQNVFAASYIVEVTDALCGLAQKTFKIKCACSYDCTIEAQITHPTCEQEGAITTNLNCLESGHAPFTYKWLDGSSLKDRNNLSPGIYCLTVSDKNACTFQNCFTVETGNDLQIALVNKQNVSSCDLGSNGSGCNGSIDIEVINGNGGYQYKWSNGANTQDLSNVCQGFYFLTVTDNLNCKKKLKVEICCCSSSNSSDLEDCFENQSNPTPLKIQGEAQGFPNPNIIVNVSGGTGDYSCSWTGPNDYIAYSCIGIGDMTEVGNYCITVNDGCDELMKCFEIVDCNQVNISTTANILNTCDGITVGSVALSITGGTPPYEVSWNNSQYSGSTIHGLSEGQYCAYVRDVNGCLEGPFCFYVGSQPGEVSTSTIPCAKTILCNGQTYSNYFEYETSWDCNTRYSYCPISGETVVEEFGWANVYVSFCTMYGICQDGQRQFIAFGETLNGPFNVLQDGCPEGQGCVNSLCSFSGQLVLDESSPIYCASVEYIQNGECGNYCTAVVSCGGTYIGSACSNLPCIQAFNDDNHSQYIAEESTEKIQIKNIIHSNQLTEWVNENHFMPIENHIVDKPHLSTQNNKIAVYPNPTSGILNIELESDKEEVATYSVINLFGQVLDNYAVKTSIGKNNFTIDLKAYQPGIYFVYTTVNKKHKTFRIVKN